MTAAEIQALEAAREDAINKIITLRLSNAYDCEKLTFNNVDVTLTKDGMDHFENVIKKITSMFHAWFDLLGEEETQHVLNILRISSDEKVALEYKKRK